MPARPATAAEVRPLRTRILRPGWVDRLATYDADDAPTTFHAAGVLAHDPTGIIHGTATIYPEPPPSHHLGALPEAVGKLGVAYRLRGMATSTEARGTGLGREMLTLCFDHIRESGGRVLWCNARVVAVGFYERMGLQTVGEEFDMPEIGPHYVMWTEV
ncbi:MAG: GNAT family N-acetyltransferase [Bacteroidota bacterium]